MKLIKLTHANADQTMYVVAELIATWWYSTGSNSTHVMFTGGGMIPVKEDVDRVKQLVKGDLNES